MSADYGVWNEERGAPNRAVIVVDKQGVIRFRRIYEAGVLPDPNEILGIIEGLG
jgi:alkyl hydroperoxide reductase subunit AhpC